MHHGVSFNFGSAKVLSPAMFETCFSHDKDIWIAATYYYMYFYIIKRPARVCMGDLQAPPAPPAQHFVFLITL